MSQFDERASQWDEEPRRVKMGLEIAKAIAETVPVNPRMRAMELGCGTGIAAVALAEKVASITAVDTSQGMLKVLQQKIDQYHITNIHPVNADVIASQVADSPFDLIYSMMAMHHIQDIKTLFSCFYGLTAEGGMVALADLDTEDGNFHKPGTDYEHKGFDRTALKNMLAEAGFSAMTDQTVYAMTREMENGPRDYSIFLITAQK